MTLLPFDPFSARSLSIVLLGLILLVTFTDNGPRGGSLVSHDGRQYVNCYGAGADAFHCRNTRNSITGGQVNVGGSF
ncbi:MAG: hypothetical protein AAF646_13390 [Pseudomonadota bacterium]